MRRKSRLGSGLASLRFLVLGLVLGWVYSLDTN